MFEEIDGTLAQKYFLSSQTFKPELQSSSVLQKHSISAFSSACFATLDLANSSNFFCLPIFLLHSNWPVFYLASYHWLVPYLLRWQPLWPTWGKEEEQEEMTHGRLFTVFEGHGCGAALSTTGWIREVSSFALKVFPFYHFFIFLNKRKPQSVIADASDSAFWLLLLLVSSCDFFNPALEIWCAHLGCAQTAAC